MVKAWVVITLLVLILTGIAVALYIFFEKPKQEQAVVLFHNLSIIAFDAHTAKPIEGNFTVVANGQSFSGHTDQNGYVLQTIETNRSFDVFLSRKGNKQAKLSYPDPNSQRPRLGVEEAFYQSENLSITQPGTLA